MSDGTILIGGGTNKTTTLKKLLEDTYTREKEDFAIAELEKVKAEVEEMRTEEPLMSRAFECYGFKDKTPEDIKTEVIELLDERISELKGE